MYFNPKAQTFNTSDVSILSDTSDEMPTEVFTNLLPDFVLGVKFVAIF